MDILKKDSDFANKLISQEKTKNPIKYDMSSPLSGLTYILDTCDPQKNPKQEKERLEKRYKTHKFFYDEFKKIKCQDQIAKPIAFFENESLENGVLGLKRNKKDSYYLMKHTQGARLHELIQNQETTYKDIKAAMSNLVLFHEFSSNAEAGEELNLEDPMDSNPNYYTCRFRDIFLKNLSKSGKNVSHKEEKELLFAYGITINSALQDTNKSIYKDANPKNYLVQDNGNVVALDIESNLKVPRHLDVVSLLEFGGDYLTSHQKNTLIEYHRNALSKIPGEDVSIEENKADYHIAAVQRHFELAGYRLGELATNSNDCIWTRDAAFYHINKGLGYLNLCIHNEYFEDSESLEKVGKTLRQILR
ncbi:MAG: hypothetical protein U9R34_03855 [Nanoarchaeota archaeon]|nr:hypothetical protein [Nanoarchaeota archaeon]